jgi:hypothetical protein
MGGLRNIVVDETLNEPQNCFIHSAEPPLKCAIHTCFGIFVGEKLEQEAAGFIEGKLYYRKFIKIMTCLCLLYKIIT